MHQSLKNNFSGQPKITKKKLMTGSNNQSMASKPNKSYDKNSINQLSSSQMTKQMMGLVQQ